VDGRESRKGAASKRERVRRRRGWGQQQRPMEAEDSPVMAAARRYIRPSSSLSRSRSLSFFSCSSPTLPPALAPSPVSAPPAPPPCTASCPACPHKLSSPSSLSICLPPTMHTSSPSISFPFALTPPPPLSNTPPQSPSTAGSLCEQARAARRRSTAVCSVIQTGDRPQHTGPGGHGVRSRFEADSSTHAVRGRILHIGKGSIDWVRCVMHWVRGVTQGWGIEV